MNELFTPTFFRRLQQLKIRTRRSFLGTRQGGHLSHRRGQGLEFSDYRVYTPGDDFRHIDWGVYGRTDRLYVREFRAELDLSFLILVDVSASMRYPEGESKFECARSLALSIGYMGLADGDTVVFAPLGRKISPRFTGAKAFQKAVGFLSSVQPEGTVDLLEEVRKAVSQHRQVGRCFFISDFLFPTEQQSETLDFLRARHFEISLVQVLAPSELSLEHSPGEIVVDAETGEELELVIDSTTEREYKRKLGSHIEQLESYCRRNGISHLVVSSGERIQEIVLTRFVEAGIVR